MDVGFQHSTERSCINCVSTGLISSVWFQISSRTNIAKNAKENFFQKKKIMIMEKKEQIQTKFH